jgi:hypothetical protein
LQVIVTEREPVADLAHRGRADAGDDTGHRVASLLARSDRPDLPLIAGEGADAAAEALEVLAAAGPLIPRLRGLVRVGDRRWDLVLDRDQRILLPDARTRCARWNACWRWTRPKTSWPRPAGRRPAQRASARRFACPRCPDRTAPRAGPCQMLETDL